MLNESNVSKPVSSPQQETRRVTETSEFSGRKEVSKIDDAIRMNGGSQRVSAGTFGSRLMSVLKESIDHLLGKGAKQTVDTKKINTDELLNLLPHSPIKIQPEATVTSPDADETKIFESSPVKKKPQPEETNVNASQKRKPKKVSRRAEKELHTVPVRRISTKPIEVRQPNFDFNTYEKPDQKGG